MLPSPQSFLQKLPKINRPLPHRTLALTQTLHIPIYSYKKTPDDDDSLQPEVAGQVQVAGPTVRFQLRARREAWQGRRALRLPEPIVGALGTPGNMQGVLGNYADYLTL